MSKAMLKGILHPEMDILFLALNPPEGSNNNGHYFSHNMSFWNLLKRSGLITKAIKDKMQADEIVFRGNAINNNSARYGVTDLVHDEVETKSAKVPIRLARHGVSRIIDILETRKVNKLCIMHSKVARAFESKGVINTEKSKYGIVGQYNNTLIYNVPFPSAPISDKEEYYKLLII